MGKILFPLLWNCLPELVEGGVGVRLQKQKKVASVFGDRNETIIIIYPGKESTYKNFMDALDEISINDIRHYFVMKPI